MRELASAQLRGIVVLLAIAAPAVLLWRWPPGPGSWYPPCPTRVWFGMHCPGCGATRACGALVRGDLSAAWSYNPAFVLVGVPLLAWAVGSALVAVATGHWPRAAFALPPRAGWWIAGLLIAYMVVRNIPIDSLSWLRPT